MDEKAGEATDKGFNDSELADIMSEIETLEKDFESPEAAAAQPEADPAVELQNMDHDALAKELAELDGDAESPAEEPSSEHKALEEAVNQAQAEQSAEADSVVESEPSVASEPVVESTPEQVQVEAPLGPQASLEVANEPQAEPEVDSQAETTEEVHAPVQAVEAVQEQAPAPVEEAQPVKVAPIRSNTPLAGGAQTKMEFSVEGNMSVALNFLVSGKQVQIHVDGQAGLVLEMEGGMRFTIPLDDDKSQAA